MVDGTSRSDPERIRISALICSLAGDDKLSIVAFDSRVAVLAEANAPLVASVALEFLSSDRVLSRSAASLALGRAAEFGGTLLSEELGDLLLVQLGTEADNGVVENIATALLHVWGRQDTHDIELRLASNPDPRYRIAAAKSLSLSSASPMASEIAGALRRLAGDEDARVRYWAQLGLVDMDST